LHRIKILFLDYVSLARKDLWPTGRLSQEPAFSTNAVWAGWIRGANSSASTGLNRYSKNLNDGRASHGYASHGHASHRHASYGHACVGLIGVGVTGMYLIGMYGPASHACVS
jgi:hypothetical protein